MFIERVNRTVSEAKRLTAITAKIDLTFKAIRNGGWLRRKHAVLAWRNLRIEGPLPTIIPVANAGAGAGAGDRPPTADASATAFRDASAASADKAKRPNSCVIQ